MPEASSGDLTIYYETEGDPGGLPLLLVVGLGAQLTWWPAGFRSALADRGFFVICYDNRDAGKSTWLDDAGPADLMAVLGGAIPPPYLLSDLAADGIAVLDALGLPSAHVLGVSMGGMIAQGLATGWPERVRSLTSVMSTTGDPAVGQPRPDITEMLLSPRPPDKAAAVEQSVSMARAISSPAFGFDEEQARVRMSADYDRGNHPDGAGRQIAAILMSGDRTAALRELSMPVLVIHGDADPMIDISGGRATAEAIPGSRLWVIPGLGHDLPAALFGELADAVAVLAKQAE
ncbi:MAG TPA: alpha/beta hydrolase [Streptosporangiaceae bacterium]|jgi:pimeloyl-ACP methyl ester carboxylesterase